MSVRILEVSVKGGVQVHVQVHVNVDVTLNVNATVDVDLNVDLNLDVNLNATVDLDRRQPRPELLRWSSGSTIRTRRRLHRPRRGHLLRSRDLLPVQP